MADAALIASTWVAPWVLQATLVAGVAWGALQLGRNWSPQARHAIVGVALLAFAVPPLLRLPFLPSAGAAAGALGELFETGGPAWTVPGPVFAAGFAVWAAGAMAVLALLAVQAWALGRLRAGAAAADDPAIRSALAEAAARVGPPRRPELLLSDRVPGPCLTGIRHPAILLPPALVKALGRRELVLVLAHELAHLRQRDVPLNALRAVLCAIWWPHPLAWSMARASRRIREEACDDTVLVSCGVAAAEYARSLVQTAAASRRARFAMASVALTDGSRVLTRRLQRLAVSRPGPSLRLTWVQRGLVIAATLAALNGPAVDVVTRTFGDTTVNFVHLSGHRAHHALQHGHHHGADQRPPGDR